MTATIISITSTSQFVISLSFFWSHCAVSVFQTASFWSVPVAPAGQHSAAQGLPHLAGHVGQPARHQRHGGQHPRVADGRGAGGSAALHHQLRPRGAPLSRHQQVPGEVPNCVVSLRCHASPSLRSAQPTYPNRMRFFPLDLRVSCERELFFVWFRRCVSAKEAPIIIKIVFLFLFFKHEIEIQRSCSF